MCGQTLRGENQSCACIWERVDHEMLPSIVQVNGINSKIVTCGTTGPASLRDPMPVELEANSELGTREDNMNYFTAWLST